MGSFLEANLKIFSENGKVNSASDFNENLVEKLSLHYEI